MRPKTWLQMPIDNEILTVHSVWPHHNRSSGEIWTIMISLTWSPHVQQPISWILLHIKQQAGLEVYRASTLQQREREREKTAMLKSAMEGRLLLRPLLLLLLISSLFFLKISSSSPPPQQIQILTAERRVCFQINRFSLLLFLLLLFPLSISHSTDAVCKLQS